MAHNALDRLILSAHVLRALAEAGQSGHAPDLDRLVESLRVGRDELSRSVDQLRADGFIEVAHLRLTSSGLAFAADLGKRRLAPLRRAGTAPRPAVPAGRGLRRVVAA